MAISNYTELKASIANWLHRDDLTSVIPDFITICESYLNDRLRLRSMIEEATVTLSTTDDFVAFPTGFIEPISFTDEYGESLSQVHQDDLKEMAYGLSSGSPEYFTITNRINFERTPSSAASYKMTYYKKLDLATDATNSVLTEYPMMYLYGSLIQAQPYLKDDKRIPVWSQLVEEAIRKANNRNQQNLRKLRTDHPSIGSSFDITRGY